MNAQDVVIIGAGPAGIAAAIQLQRLGVTPLVIERGPFGGLLNNANLVENYPGFPQGISGPELVALFHEQFKRFDIPTRRACVEEVIFTKECFILRTSDGEIPAERVVAASGTAPRRFNDGVCDTAAQVHYEVFPLLGLEDAQVVIVGAGDAAFDYALNLARHNQVTVLNRGVRVKALGLLVERAARHPRITYTPACDVRKISTQGTGFLVTGEAPDGAFELHADRVIGALGRRPAVEFISESVSSQEEALAAAGKWHLIGDVHNGLFRQTAIAVGEGIRAAMAIHQSMEAV